MTENTSELTEGRPQKRFVSEETRRLISIAGKGKKRSDETRQRMREARMAMLEREKAAGIKRVRSPETIAKWAATMAKKRIADEAYYAQKRKERGESE